MLNFMHMTTQNPFMTLERARSTFWLKNNHRPMGELFDSGYLTKSRLEWAFNKAYDPQIRAASEVLLKQKQRQVQGNIEKGKLPRNIDEARIVTWPFSQRTGKPGASIGQLLDERSLSKSDLAYAIDKAWDEQVRTAAHIILSGQLGIETEKMNESKGALKVTAPQKSYSVTQSLQIASKKGIFIGASLAILIVFLIVDILYMLSSGALPALYKFSTETKGIGFAIIILFCFVGITIGNIISKRMFEKKVDAYSDEINNYQNGKIGEDKVIDAMREALDGSCHVFRNVMLPGRKQDIDAVLVSPQGVFAFEIKNWTGKFENTGSNWEYYSGKKKRKTKDNPTKQVKGNAAELWKFLEAVYARNNTKEPRIEGIVVLANADVICYEKDPEARIWRIERIIDEFSNSPDARVISEKIQAEVCEKLGELYKN